MKISATFLGVGSNTNLKMGAPNVLLELEQDKFISCPFGVSDCIGPQGDTRNPDAPVCPVCVATSMRNPLMRSCEESYRILVDCSQLAYSKLVELGLTHQDIDVYLITSLFSNSVAGLEFAARMNHTVYNRKYFEDGRFITDNEPNEDEDNYEITDEEENSSVDIRPLLAMANWLRSKQSRNIHRFLLDLTDIMSLFHNVMSIDEQEIFKIVSLFSNPLKYPIPIQLDLQRWVSHVDEVEITSFSTSSRFDSMFSSYLIKSSSMRLFIFSGHIECYSLIKHLANEPTDVILILGPVVEWDELLKVNIKGRMIIAGIDDVVPNKLPVGMEIAVPLRKYVLEE